MLNLLPIFYLSFLKMSVKVWRKIVKIQRVSLGGVRGGHKISWVKWRMVCQLKCDGALGVRDVRVANLSFLVKWRWRVIQNDKAIWKDVLIEKYGHGIGNFVVDGNGVWPRYKSSWWKDILKLEKVVGSNWFNLEVVRKVKNGRRTSFWKDPWKGKSLFV